MYCFPYQRPTQNLNNVRAPRSPYQWYAAAASSETFKCQYLEILQKNERKNKITEGWWAAQQDSLRCTIKKKIQELHAQSLPVPVGPSARSCLTPV